MAEAGLKKVGTGTKTPVGGDEVMVWLVRLDKMMDSGGPRCPQDFGTNFEISQLYIEVMETRGSMRDTDVLLFVTSASFVP